MDASRLNGIFDADGRPRTDGLDDGVVHIDTAASVNSGVSVHEYHIDDTVVFVPDGSAARNSGSTIVDQSVDASLAIQVRVRHLEGDGDYAEHSVLVYTPNAADAQVAVLAGYANGVKTVAVDDGQALPVSTATDFGRDFTARGGEIRGGGEIITIREDLGIGSPVSLVEIDVTPGADTSGSRVSVRDAKEIGQGLVQDIMVDEVADTLVKPNPEIPLSALGPSAVIDANGDALGLIGSVGGVALRGSYAGTLVANIGVDAALTTANKAWNDVLPGDLVQEESAIGQQLGADWLSGTNFSDVGQGESSMLDVRAAGAVLGQIAEVESARSLVLADPRAIQAPALQQDLLDSLDNHQSQLGEELAFWESRLQTDEQVALALAVGSSGFEETARGHLEATRALEQARAAQRELTEHGRLVEDYPSEYRQLQLSEYDTVIPVLESRVAASQAEIASIIHAGESVAGLIEPGATLADSAVVRDWYSGMQAGRGASQALDDLIFDDAGELSATLVDYYDTPEMRAAFEAQYTGPEEGRAEAELNFRRDAAANHVVQSGATTRSFAGIRDLEVPGNPLVYGPGRGAVDLEQIGIQPVLDLRLDLDPTRESGSLPEDLRYLDTDDTRAAFYASASNPVQLASIGGDAGFDDVAVRAQEAAYTDYLRTIQSTGRHPDPDEIDKWVDSTGRDASIALRLDVPGNPNAPGYHFDPRRSAADGGGGGWDGGSVHRQADGSIVREVDGAGAGAAAIGTMMSLYAIKRAVDDGDTLGALAQGARFVNSLPPGGGGSGQGAQAGGAGKAGQFAAAIDFARAIDGGDSADILVSGASLVLSTAAGRAAVDSLFGVQAGANVPYVAYLQAAISLAEGDVKGAVVTAGIGKMAAAAGVAGPIGVAVVLLFQFVAGKLMEPDDPSATLSFRRGEDGELGFETFSNETGEGLEAHLQGEAGASLVGLLESFESQWGHVLAGGRIDAGALPALTLTMELGREGVEWRLEGGRNLEGGVQLLGKDPSGEEIARALRDTMLISHRQAHWQVGEKRFVDPASGAVVTETYWIPGGQSVGGQHASRAVGAGVFAGGGNVGGRRGVTVARDADIVSLGVPRVPPAAMALAEVTRTWNVERGLFAGEGGRLLAAAVGASLVSLEAVAGALVRPLPRSVFEHEATAGLVGHVDGVIVAGRGVFLNGDASRADAGVGEDGVRVPGAAAGGSGEPDWLLLYPNALPDGPVATSSDALPYVVTSADPAHAPVVDHDPFAEARAFARQIRRLAGDEGEGAATGPESRAAPVVVDGPPPVHLLLERGPADGFADGGSGAPGRPAVPVAHVTSVVEDRFLVTDAAHLLVGEAEGARLVDVGAARHGSVEVQANGDIHFIPDPDFAGEAGFLYRVELPDGLIVERQALIAVTEVNDAPAAVDDTLAGIEDGSIDLGAVLSNDRDADGDALRVVAVGQVEHGRVTGDAASGFRFVPDPHFHGEVQLVYVVEDGAGARSVARATLTIAEGANDAPEVTHGVVAAGLEDTPLVLHEDALLAAVTDPEGDVVSIEGVRAASGGEVHFDRNTGEVTFLPDADFHGEAELQIDVVDARGARGSGTMAVRIENALDPIVAGGAQVSVPGGTVTVIPEQALLAALAIDNPDGGEVRVVGARMVEGEAGRVTRLEDGAVQWISAPGMSGASAFEVRISNGTTRTEARVEVTVQPALPGAGYEALAGTLAGDDGQDAGAAADELDTAGDSDDGGATTDGSGEDGGAGDDTTSDGPGGASPGDPDPLALLADADGPDGSAGGGDTGDTGDAGGSAPGDAGEDLTGVILAGTEDEPLDFRLAELLPAGSGDDVAFREVALGDPGAGLLAVDLAAGTATFTPAADFFGTVAVDYRARVEGVDTSGRAALAIANVDDAPRVADRDYKAPHFNIDEDQVTVFTPRALVGSDTDVDGDALVVTAVRLHDERQGRASVTEAGNVLFEPAADHHGDVAFEVDVSDGTSTVSATMTVRVWPVNDAPRPADDHAVIDEDTTLRIGIDTLLGNDADVDGPLAPRLVGVWAAAGGSARLDDAAGELVFAPAADFHGEAWVDTIVADTEGAWSVSRLTIDVAGVHDPVVARDDVVRIAEDAEVFIPLAEFTANDFNPDGGPLALTALDTGGIEHGTLLIERGAAGEGVRYRPEADWHGSGTFTYTVTDAAGHASSATVTLDVEPVNDAPLLAPWHLAGTEDEPVTIAIDDLNARASDVEGDWTQVAAVTSDDGTIDHDPVRGTVTFTPRAHLNTALNGGALEIAYLVVDEGGAVGEGLVSIDLAAVDDPPEAVDDVVLAWEAGPGGYTNVVHGAWLTANDREHDGETLTLTAVAGDTVDGAVLAFEADRQVVRYTAAPGFTGADAFSYTVADPAGGAATATVTVHVLDNRPPEAHDFATSAAEDTALIFGIEDFAAHVVDPDRELAEMPERLTVVEVGGAVNGEVVLAPDGRVVFIPFDHYNSVEHGGVAGFDYVVEDIVGHRTSASASIVYTPVNDAPVGTGEHLGTIDEDSAGLVFTGAQLLANDLDIEGDPLTVVDVAASGGSIRALGADTWQYVPAPDFNGSADIVYRVSDGALSSEVVSKVTVNPVNDRPIVEYDRADGYDNGVHNTATGLLSNDVDVDGDALHIGGITGTSSNVHVTGVGTGAISWQASSAGAGWITYTVSDGNGGVTESRLDLAIAHRAIPPEFVSVTMSPTEGTYRNVTVHVQNGGRLTVTAFGTARATDPDGPDHMIEYSGTGIAVEPGSGNWTYTTQLRLSAAEAGPGNWVTRSVEVPVMIHATDVEGNSVTRSQTFTYSARIQMNIASKPVVLDLDGDGVHLVGIGDSAAGFDFDGDGVADASGWIAGDGDALLAFDHDGDRRVTRADEIAFVGYVEGAETDLEGLAAFDSDGDGRLTANDEAWAAFGLWVDDGDGVADAGEFEDLDGAGITGIDLVSDGREVLVEGNVIHGEALFTRADGSAGVAADVGFAWVRGGEVEAELVGLDADAGDDGGVDAGADAGGTIPGADGAGETIDQREADGGLDEDIAESGDGADADSDTHADDGTASVRDAASATPGPDGEASLAGEPDESGAAVDDAAGDPADGQTADDGADAPGGAEGQGGTTTDADGWLPSDEELDRMAQAEIEQLARAPSQETVTPVPESGYVPVEAGNDDAIDEPASMVG